MNNILSFWVRCLPALLLAGSVALVGTVTHAASPIEDAAPFVRVDPEIIEHLRTEIRDRDRDRRERALVDVIALAGCGASCLVQLQSLPGRTVRTDEYETGLIELGPALLRAYRSGPTDQHRLLALSALINVGDEERIDSLVENPIPVSSTLARATQRQLVAFYLDRYPELQYRARSGIFSLDDVRMARARHERVLRKQARRG